MITPSFSPTATERVLPKLALDFTTAVLDSRVTFTRTTDATHPATYVNSSGYITSATNNQARFDYDPVALTCKGLLIEESRTNYLTYSNDLTNAAWNYSSAGTGQASTGAAISPDGTLNANKLYEAPAAAGAVNQRRISNDASNGTVTVRTLSFYAKKAERQRVYAYCSGPNQGAWWDLNSGTCGPATDYPGSPAAAPVITAAGDGWYRCTITYNSANMGSLSLVVVSNNATTFDIRVGDGVSGIYTYGLDLQVGAFPTSHIPTTSAALTRNADVATMTGTNFSSWWIATIGAANVSVIPKSISGTKPLFQMDDGTADNIISLRGNVANPELYIKATTDQAQIDAGTIVANIAYKLAGAWNTNNCVAAQNGAAAVTDTSAIIPTVTQARIGSDGTNYANGWLQKINYWPQRITDNETQAFSK